MLLCGYFISINVCRSSYMDCDIINMEVKMAIYKDEQRGTWYCSTYYESWDGTKKRHHKRGFRTKKEAQKYEAEFLSIKQASMDMLLKNFVEVYFQDKAKELKERSITSKRHMINKHIIPVFGNKAMNKITPSSIVQWQNSMIEKGYQPTYLRMVQNQLSALFNHAYRIYGLKENPCSKVKKMGKADANKMNFWTKDEYERFLKTVDKSGYYHMLFELLFWTGCRIGEALALTQKDVDLVNSCIYINKTYYRGNSTDVITSPKTETSNRTIDIPEFLLDELKEYMGRIYGIEGNERIFPITTRAVQAYMKRHVVVAGVKEIRVHDLRHSHVAYLIDQGVEPLLIKERLGHRDIKITLNTYGHLYPNRQKKVAQMLDATRN